MFPMIPAVPSVYLVVGFILLLMGRQVFWLFVGTAGFIYGMEFGARLFPEFTEGGVVFFALALGIASGVLAVFLQRLTLGLAGFLVGGYIFFYAVSELGFFGPDFPWIPYLIGGTIGFVLTVFLFDWALIILSVLIGTLLILENLPLGPVWLVLTASALFLLGISVQAQLLSRA